MKIEEMQIVCNELQAALVAKGKLPSEAYFWIESNTDFVLRLSWKKPNPRASWETEGESFRGADVQKIIKDARRFIAKLPSAKEAKFNEFMGALGNVIDLGRKNGIEVEFINPLTETMKRLSENTLTDQRVA